MILLFLMYEYILPLWCFQKINLLYITQLQEPKLEEPTAAEENDQEEDAVEKDEDAEVDEQIAGLQVKTRNEF